MSKVEEKM